MKYSLKFYAKYHLSKFRANFLYKFMGLIYSSEIKVGDKIKCHGIGYFHWKGEEFICTTDFLDGTIGIKDSVRVSKKDFRKL